MIYFFSRAEFFVPEFPEFIFIIFCKKFGVCDNKIIIVFIIAVICWIEAASGNYFLVYYTEFIMAELILIV